MKRKPNLLVIGPLPPPYHGVTLSIPLLLENTTLQERFQIDHVDTSDHRGLANLGRWEVRNVLLALGNLGGLVRRLVHGRGVVYLPLSQNPAAFARDSLFVFSASALRWKVAAHLHGTDFREFYDRSGRIVRWWVRLTLARIDSVAVMGRSLGWVVEGLVPPDQVAVVWNGAAEPDTSGATRDPNRIVFLSNLLRRKGVVEAAGAARLVLDRHPDARFVFAGQWEDDLLRDEVVALLQGCAGGIEFRSVTTVAERDALLGSSSIMLFPPVGQEGHPRVVIEGLAAGLPVVTTARGAIAETVVDGESGFVLDDPLPQALAEKLLLLLEDRRLLETMSAAARARYLARFTQAQADHALADWLSDVAHGRPSVHLNVGVADEMVERS